MHGNLLVARRLLGTFGKRSPRVMDDDAVVPDVHGCGGGSLPTTDDFVRFEHVIPVDCAVLGPQVGSLLFRR